jgi:uncharacterized repeat protein (TIGR01451 family)/LPXTG-motif cell wall-anchored protein
MNAKNRPLAKTAILAAILLLSGVIFLTTAQAAPPAQDPLPTITFETPVSQDPRPPVDDGTTGGAGQGDGTGNGGSPDARCASLSGQIINWGVGGIPGIGATLSDGSWQVSAASGSDGNYGFGGLGIGVARLRIDIPPGQPLTPSIQDAGVYLNCNYSIIANVAVYSGSEIDPPATITLSAPNTIASGAELPLKVTIKNDLPNDITNVVVTDLLPEELIALEVTTSSGSGADARIIETGENGQLVTVFFDRLGSGDEVNIFITVILDEGISRGTEINNAVTLFYRESVAVQDSLELTVGSAEEPAPAAFPTPEAAAPATPEPSAIATPAAITGTAAVSPTVTASEEENFVPPDNMPTTGDSFLPPPALLPTTGEDTLQLSATLPETGFNPVWLPLGGFGLAGLAFICHRLRLFLRRLK